MDLLEHGRAYAARCVENAQALAAALDAEGFEVMARDHGFTRSHHVGVDARTLGGGTRAARRLEAGNILATGIPLPLPPVAGDYNGLRLGTQEVTRWGMGPDEMAAAADLMASLLLRDEPPEAIRRAVVALRAPFHRIRYCIET